MSTEPYSACATREELVGRRTVEISPEFLLEMVSGHFPVIRDNVVISVCRDKIPDNATALRLGLSESGGVMLVIESPDFEPMRHGDRMLSCTPLFCCEALAPDEQDAVSAIIEAHRAGRPLIE